MKFEVNRIGLNKHVCLGRIRHLKKKMCDSLSLRTQTTMTIPTLLFFVH